MKYWFIIITGILFSLTAAGQSVDVLILKKKRHFKETALFYRDSALTIIYEICYNKPRTMDEEYCRSISFIVTDTAKFRQSLTLDVEKDSSIIRCTCNRLSVWHWENVKSSITGQVKIVSVSETEIKLEMNIFVQAGEEYIYNGTRKFKKSKTGMLQLLQ
jgi:hypothetical protein